VIQIWKSSATILSVEKILDQDIIAITPAQNGRQGIGLASGLGLLTKALGHNID
jgi:hypothetical protein